MKRAISFKTHDIPIYNQVASSIYGLLDHEKQENENLPINPNSLQFKDKTLDEKLSESLYKDTKNPGVSEEFKSNLLLFYIFHLSFLLIFFTITVLLFTTNSQSYNHFTLRITFLSVIFIISLLILFFVLVFPNLLSKSRQMFTGLGLIVGVYLILCDERILSGISGQKYNSSCSSTVLLIGLYTVMYRHVLLDSFVYLLIISTFALSLSLITIVAFSSVSVLSGLGDLLILLVFLVIQVMETHKMDYRTRQLF